MPRWVGCDNKLGLRINVSEGGVQDMNVKEAITKYQKELERVPGILDKLEKVQHLAITKVTPETSLEELICKRYLQVGKVEDVLKEVKAVDIKIYTSLHIRYA